MTQDGTLGYQYDANGNRPLVTYLALRDLFIRASSYLGLLRAFELSSFGGKDSFAVPFSWLSLFAWGCFVGSYCVSCGRNPRWLRLRRFGRVTQDGALTYQYDANGNRSPITYPGGVTVSYTYDFADRQSTLSYNTGSGASRW